MAKQMGNITANGAYVRAFQVKLYKIVQLIKPERSVNTKFVCVDFPKFFLFEIEFVLNVADQLLQDILQHHHPNCSAKLIHHQCKMRVLSQE